MSGLVTKSPSGLSVVGRQNPGLVTRKGALAGGGGGVVGGSVSAIATSSPNKIYLYDWDEDEIVEDWDLLGAPIDISVHPDGYVAVYSLSEGHAYLYETDGTLVWTSDNFGSNNNSNRIAIAPNSKKVLVGTGDLVRCLNYEDGTLDWFSNFGNTCRGTVVDKDDNVYSFRSGASFRKFDIEGNQLLDVSAPSATEAILSPDGSTYLFGGGGALHRRDTSDGSDKGSISTEDSSSFAMILTVLPNGDVYINDQSAWHYFFDVDGEVTHWTDDNVSNPNCRGRVNPNGLVLLGNPLSTVEPEVGGTATPWSHPEFSGSIVASYPLLGEIDNFPENWGL